METSLCICWHKPSCAKQLACRSKCLLSSYFFFSLDLNLIPKWLSSVSLADVSLCMLVILFPNRAKHWLCASMPKDSCVQNLGAFPPTRNQAQIRKNAQCRNMAQFHKNGAMEILHGQEARNHGQKRSSHGQKRRVPAPNSKTIFVSEERRMPEISAAIKWNTVSLDQH